ncbi:MAG TPA: hypothetical protein VIN33_09830 [Marinobacter sp.]
MAISWLQDLAFQAPVPVFPVVGRAGEPALEALYLSPAVSVTRSPRHARALAVLGTVEQRDYAAFRRIHDQVPAPRITLWFSDTPIPESLQSSAVLVDASEEMGPQLKQALRALNEGKHTGDGNLCPDEPPAPWKGVGDGHGGEGMMGGKPYGRPMAMPEEDLRDGLQLDPLAFSMGPFSPLLPPGMVIEGALHGDVVARMEVVHQPYEYTLPAVFYQALERPVAIADLELARAACLLRSLAGALQLVGLGAYASRLRSRVAGLRPGQTITDVAGSRVWQSLRWSAGAEKGVVDGIATARLRGPAARAAGDPNDARQHDPAYGRLGFKPVTQNQGTCAARWKQWLEEAEQALALAEAADRSHAMSSPSGVLETPFGPLTASEPLVDCSDVVLPLLTGLEWSEAMSVLSSFHLSAVQGPNAPRGRGHQP